MSCPCKKYLSTLPSSPSASVPLCPSPEIIQREQTIRIPYAEPVYYEIPFQQRIPIPKPIYQQTVIRPEYYRVSVPIYKPKIEYQYEVIPQYIHTYRYEMNPFGFNASYMPSANILH